MISNDPDLADATSFQAVENLLGLEAHWVVVDLFDGLNLDVLCMAAGLVRAPGALVLLAPIDLSSLHDRYAFATEVTGDDGFFAWQLQRLARASACVQYRQDRPAPPVGEFPPAVFGAIDGALTAGQQCLLERVSRWFEQTQSAAFVITANRGRGKSTLLGFIARAEAETGRRVIVTAASRAQASVLLQRAGQHPAVEFVAPDELIQRSQILDLLLIDEAAVLPLGMLEQLLGLARRTLLATTTGGYEGSGQGFLLRFLQRLGHVGYHQASLDQPVRWGQHDLLEQHLNHELMLGHAFESTRPPIDGLDFELCDKWQLRNDRQLLQSIYLLLVSAHYRTRPSDLRQLLEDTQQQVLIARAQDQVVGVLLLLHEGGLDVELCHEVFMGRRRPAGNLLAQMLTAQAGLANFACYQGGRIQRIAVGPKLRRQGIGRGLVDFARDLVGQQGLQYLGASFALDASSLSFWKATGFDLVHIGAAPGRASGRQSVAVLQSGVREIQRLIEQQRNQVLSSLSLLFLTRCNQLDWRDARALLAVVDPGSPLTKTHLEQLQAFIHGHRGFDYSQLLLQHVLLVHHRRLDQLDQDTQRLLIDRILFNRPWPDNPGGLAGGGRKALTRRIRQAVGSLLPESSKAAPQVPENRK